MNKKLLGAMMLFTSMTSMTSYALECDKEERLAEVSGQVITTNLSEYIQVGQIHLKLTDVDDGAVLFEGKGGIMGQKIKEQDGITYLNHYACFNAKDCLFTRKDKAVIVGPPVGCDIPVREEIRRISGKGSLENLRARVVAEGTISLCPGQQNQLVLQGWACLETK